MIKKMLIFAVVFSILSCGKKENIVTSESHPIILEGTATNSRFYSNNSFFNEETTEKAFAENELDFWILVEQGRHGNMPYPQKFIKNIKKLGKKSFKKHNCLFITLPEFSEDIREDDIAFYFPVVREASTAPVSPFMREMKRKILFGTVATGFGGKISGYLEEYQNYLDRGFIFGAFQSSNLLGPDWKIQNTPRFCIIARERTPEALKEALKARHTFVSFEKGTVMSMEIEDAQIGDILEAEMDKKSFAYHWRVTSASLPLGKVELITNNGEILAETQVQQSESLFLENSGFLNLDRAFQYVMLVAYFENGRLAYSTPVWIRKKQSIMVSGISVENENQQTGELSKVISFTISNISPVTISNINVRFLDSRNNCIHEEKMNLNGRSDVEIKRVLPEKADSLTNLRIETSINDEIFTCDTVEFPRTQQHKILVDATHKNKYTENLNTLKKMMENDGVLFSVSAERTPFMKDAVLQDYDLVILTPPQFISDNVNYEVHFSYALHRFVHHGGALIIAADGRDETKARAAVTYYNRLLRILYSPVRFRYTTSIGFFSIYDEENYFHDSENPLFASFNHSVYGQNLKSIYLPCPVELIASSNTGEIYPMLAYNTISLVQLSQSTRIKNRRLDPAQNKNRSAAVITGFGKGKICILSGMNFSDYDIDYLDNKQWIHKTIQYLLGIKGENNAFYGIASMGKRNSAGNF